MHTIFGLVRAAEWLPLQTAASQRCCHCQHAYSAPEACLSFRCCDWSDVSIFFPPSPLPFARCGCLLLTSVLLEDASWRSTDRMDRLPVLPSSPCHAWLPGAQDLCRRILRPSREHGETRFGTAVLMDHVTNTRPTAHNPRATCSSDVRAEEASARPTRIRYTWSCIMFAAPPARADKTAEASLRGTCVLAQARRPRTSSARRQRPQGRTSRDHSVCCRGKDPPSL